MLPSSIKDGMRNLQQLLERADTLDYEDGCKAYIRYHDLLTRIAHKYETDFYRTCAAFCALSPNNDYVGNLRSLVTLLDIKQRDGDAAMYRGTVSTYKHCRDRAITYLTGQVDFLETVKGQKITAFYHNISDPTLWGPVTVDGHMVAAYIDDPAMKMKDAVQWLTRARYVEVSIALQELAHAKRMLPHQMQAILWFTRKRTLGIKYTAQMDMLGPPGQGQRVTFDLDHIHPFTSGFRDPRARQGNLLTA